MIPLHEEKDAHILTLHFGLCMPLLYTQRSLCPTTGTSFVELISDKGYTALLKTRSRETARARGKRIYTAHMFCVLGVEGAELDGLVVEAWAKHKFIMHHREIDHQLFITFQYGQGRAGAHHLTEFLSPC